QRRELEDIAERHGWNVVEVFQDRGVSGAKSREQRPAMRRLMRALRAVTSTRSPRGRWIVWEDHCKTWSAFSAISMPKTLTCTCTSRDWTLRHHPGAPCFRCWGYLPSLRGQ